MKISTLLLAAILVAPCCGAQSIYTIAGNGPAAYSGDGGAATAASLRSPFAVTVDTAGNVYIADRFNHRVRKVTPAGIITTIAGIGTAGYSGDGGAATAAQLNGPTGVAADTAGNVYVADKDNHRIRKISAAGIITTVAGNGTAGYAGDGSIATGAVLNGPRSIAVGKASGRILIADQGNHRVRSIDAAGNITTMAGNGTSGYSGDGGIAASAQLYNPAGIAEMPNGDVLIADVDNVMIRIVHAGVINKLAGTTAGYSGDGGAATDAQLNEPIGVAADDSGNVYIADGWNHRIRKINTAGIISTLGGNGAAGYTGDGGPATMAAMYHPYGVAVDKSGYVYLADYDNNRVRRIGGWSTAINGAERVASVSVFPNPAKGTLQVQWSFDVSATLYVYNIGGAMVLQMPVSGGNANINIADLKAGVYTLSVVHGGKAVVTTFIKQ